MEAAVDYFNKIPDGHRNAMPRPTDKGVDRMLRKMIENANKNGDCIINTGNGYYRPIPQDPTDEAEWNAYLAKELSRARSVLLKREKMKKAYKKRIENGILASYQGKIG